MFIPAVSNSDGLPLYRRRLDPRNPADSLPHTTTHFRDAQVEISPQAEKLRTHDGLLRSSLSAVEDELFPAGRPLEEADRRHYLGALAGQVEASPESTAEQIMGGVQGYLFRAFMAQHPGATPEDFEHFKAAVMRGFERGFFDARSSPALEPELAAELRHTEERVRGGLDEFFTRESERAELRALLSRR